MQWWRSTRQGMKRYAQRIYNELRQLYPRPEFNVPIAVFARAQIQGYIKNLDTKSAVQMMVMMLREGYKGYALHDDDEAYSQEKMAKEIYDNVSGGLANRQKYAKRICLRILG